MITVVESAKDDQSCAGCTYEDRSKRESVKFFQLAVTYDNRRTLTVYCDVCLSKVVLEALYCMLQAGNLDPQAMSNLQACGITFP
jgi:hypothetical protein